MASDPLTRTTSRRAFLAGAAGLVVAAACGKSGSSGSGATATTAGQGDLPVNGSPATGDVYVANDLRFPFGVLRKGQGGFDTVVGEPVTISFSGPDGASLPARAATFRSEGLAGTEHQGIYETTVSFPKAGAWWANLEVKGKKGRFAVQVNAEPDNPAPGKPAIVTPSPTPSHTLGVDPICTRDPACPLHDVSLDDALKSGKPVVLLFATPARCTSRWCGPVLDVLLDAKGPYEGRATFIHVEIYENMTSNKLAPTVAKWDLSFEPILYGIAPDGTIEQRLDGAFDEREVKQALGALIA